MHPSGTGRGKCSGRSGGPGRGASGLAGPADLRGGLHSPVRRGDDVVAAPISQARRDELAVAYARDGYRLLETVYDPQAPAGLADLPTVDILRQVLLQNYTRTVTSSGREVIRRREKAPDGDGLPPGHLRIASPYDTDARWAAKRDEFRLGYKLHITETCDDAGPCRCRQPNTPAKTDRAGVTSRHEPACPQPRPNLITHVATTTATVTDTQMTAAQQRGEQFDVDPARACAVTNDLAVDGQPVEPVHAVGQFGLVQAVVLPPGGDALGQPRLNPGVGVRGVDVGDDPADRGRAGRLHHTGGRADPGPTATSKSVGNSADRSPASRK